MTRIAAIVVTFNSESEIGPCLDALEGRAEVLLVDNASVDGTHAEVRSRPWVRFVENTVNRGFAGAVNQGVAATDAPLILLLNPDAHVESDLDALADACEKYGIAAGRLIGSDGKTQTGFTIRRFPSWTALAFESLGLNRLWPGNPVNRNYRYLDRDLSFDGEADQPAGAFLMVKRELFQRLGGFDEAFHPIWFEDVDFLKRAAELGVRARYVPSVVARHSGAHSIGRITGECRTRFWYASLLRYAAKHFSTMQFRAVSGSVALGCLLRLVTGIFTEQKNSVVFRQVIRIAAGGVWRGQLCSGGEPEVKWSEGDARAMASHSAQR